MKISEKNFQTGYNVLLMLICGTFFFRKLCTLLILVFVLYNLLFIRRMQFPPQGQIWALIIASPMLLEMVFFWNNDDYSLGLKAAEKSLSLVLFPLFILGNYKQLQFERLLRTYCTWTSLLMLALLVRFVFLEPDSVIKYIEGRDLWEMGYVFVFSFKNHAPSVNLHLSFVAVGLFYFLFKDFRLKKVWWRLVIDGLLLLLAVFAVLVVNTRIALCTMVVGFAVIIAYEGYTYCGLKKLLLIGLCSSLGLGGILFLFVKANPYMIEKYSVTTFAYMDKVGRLDEIENPEKKVFNSLATRVSIWKSALELSQRSPWVGFGSADAKGELFAYYEESDQHFLAKYEFPVHNQFLDFMLKFGVLGFVVVLVFISSIGYLGLKMKSGIVVVFFINFFASNLMDDYLILFNGIVFSGFWFSIFAARYLQSKLAAVDGV